MPRIQEKNVETTYIHQYTITSQVEIDVWLDLLPANFNPLILLIKNPLADPLANIPWIDQGFERESYILESKLTAFKKLTTGSRWLKLFLFTIQSLELGELRICKDLFIVVKLLNLFIIKLRFQFLRVGHLAYSLHKIFLNTVVSFFSNSKHA